MSVLLNGILSGILALVGTLAFIIGLHASVPSDPNTNNSFDNDNEQIQDDHIGFKCEPTNKK